MNRTSNESEEVPRESTALDAAGGTPADYSGCYQVSFELSHSRCWTCEVTSNADARLLVTAVSPLGDQHKAHVTVFGRSTDAVSTLVDAMRRSSTTSVVSEVSAEPGFDGRTTPVSKPSQSLLVEYAPEASRYDAIVSRGFLPCEPIRVRDGTEYWTVAGDKSRSSVRDELAAISRERDAQLTVRRITSQDGASGGSEMDPRRLSDRQREIFELAKDRGYYSWPRETSGSELATELGLSKTTVFEHLRKAEAKILGPV